MKTGSYRLSTRENRQRLTRGLGWFSLGLGLVQVLAPRTLSRFVGVRPRPFLMRLLGFRELASGVGLLRRGQTGGWLQARVAGDAMDLGLLGLGLLSRRSGKFRLTLTTVAAAGVGALDLLCREDYRQGPGTHVSRPGTVRGAMRVEKTIIVNRPPEELYALWHDFEQLPRFMSHLLVVRTQGNQLSHWVARGPAGSRVEWDAEVINDHTNELIAWRSLEGADVDHAGSVRFSPAPGGRGTLVRVELEYRPPAGATGARLAKWLGQDLEAQLAADLVRFRQFAETGELARTEGQPAGRGYGFLWKAEELPRAA